MKQQESISKSPITNAPLEPFLSCTDFTVSQEKFTILKDTQLDFLVTSPRPLDDDLMHYYESEDYISHTDADDNLFDKTYQFVRKITIKSKIEKLKKVHPSATSILDVGCGTGDFLESCLKNDYEVFGIEPNKQARELGLQKINKNSVFDSFDSLKKVTNCKFDVITLWHVLEHVPNLLEYVKTLKKLLNPNGVLVIAVPNFKSYDAHHYKEFWAAYDVPRHLWHFSKTAIATLFKKVDLKIVKTHPMIFDAFYVSILSEKNNRNSFKNLRAFCVGVFSNFEALFTKEYSSRIYILKRVKKAFKAN
ncbi:MAG: class I SAM-dependent methyltransferase [Flavobacteriaceae bacterium]